MEWLFEHLTQLTDAASSGNMLFLLVIVILLAGGLGFPLPEDIPLLVGGYLCYKGLAHIELMLPATIAAVLGADSLIFLLGRRYGHLVPRIPYLKHHLSPARLTRAGDSFHRHGGKTLFIARFLPGLRAPVFFTAGLFKIPFWKFLLYDGGAAMLSVPLWVLLAYRFGGRIEQVREWAGDAQTVILIGFGVAIISALVWHFFIRKRSEHPPEPDLAEPPSAPLAQREARPPGPKPIGSVSASIGKSAPVLPTVAPASRDAQS